MNKNVLLTMVAAFFICTGITVWFFISEIYFATSQEGSTATFIVNPNENITELATRLEKEGIVRSATLLRRYLVAKGLDTQVRAGEFRVEAPVTIARVALSLADPNESERTITILPGWDIREIAKYLEKEGYGNYDEIVALAGKPAFWYSAGEDTLGLAKTYKIVSEKPTGISYEGYFRPDTYRIFTNATVKEILERLVKERDAQFTQEVYEDIKKTGRSVHEVITMASILEREVRTVEDRKIVADMLWRRYDENWALQVDSSVHYVTGDGIDGNEDVFTSAEERQTDSAWNTYKYPGLPPGPISNPSMESILAASHPTKNTYNYFLTTLDTGEVKYARTLDEHNANKARYLR